jgi:hypothetical protein
MEIEKSLGFPGLFRRSFEIASLRGQSAEGDADAASDSSDEKGGDEDDAHRYQASFAGQGCRDSDRVAETADLEIECLCVIEPEDGQNLSPESRRSFLSQFLSCAGQHQICAEVSPNRNNEQDQAEISGRRVNGGSAESEYR